MPPSLRRSCILIVALGLLSLAGPAPSSADPAPADSSLQQIAEAALPTSIEDLPREFVTITKDSGPPDGYVGRIDAGYKIDDTHTFKVAVEYHRPGNRRLKQRTRWYAQKDPYSTVQGHSVYKRTYGRVGSGVSVLIADGPVHTLVVIRSPRLLKKHRKKLPPEKRSDVPAPEAGLDGMDLSRLHSLAPRFQ